LLGVFERLGGLRRVENHLVVLVDEIAAERPQAPVHPGVTVSGGMTERHAAGVLLRFVALAYSRNSSVVAGNFERPAFFNAEMR